MRDHLERIRLLVKLASEITDQAARFRLQLAAIYSCRAIPEIMLGAAELQMVRRVADTDAKRSRDMLEGEIAVQLPYYYLVERIRIHDFHRFGISPPDPNVFELSVGGPIKLTVQTGSVAVIMTGAGPQVTTSGSSSARLQRPLTVQNGRFLNDESGELVSLDQILDANLRELPHVLETFGKLLAGES